MGLTSVSKLFTRVLSASFRLSVKTQAKAASKNPDVEDEIAEKLLLFISVLFCSLCVLCASSIIRKQDNYGGVSILALIGVTTSLILIYVFRKKLPRFIPSFVITYTCIVSGILCSVRWGLDLFISIAFFVCACTLVILTAQIQKAIAVTTAIIATMLILWFLQINGYTNEDGSWRLLIEPTDIIEIVAITITIAFGTYLARQKIINYVYIANAQKEILEKQNEYLEKELALRMDEFTKIQNLALNHEMKYVEMGKIATGLVHDIANPLSAININIENIDSDSEHKKLATKSIHAIQNIIRICTSLAKNPSSVIEKIYSQKIFQDLETIFRYKLSSNNVTLNFKSESNYFYSDQGAVIQIFLNLISNAIDVLATEKISNKNILINIQVSDQIVISCLDNGPEIPKRVVDTIGQLQQTTKGGSHLGIGLVTASKIASQILNGKISASNKHEKIDGIIYRKSFVLTIPTPTLPTQ